MKPIKVWNLDIGVGMKPTGVADLNIEVKMTPIGVGNPDVEVKMNETDLLDPDIEVKMNVILHFDPDAEVKTVNNEVGMKPPGQILPESFHLFVEFAAKQYYICRWYTKTQRIEKT